MVDGSYSKAIEAADQFGGADGYGHVDHDEDSMFQIEDQDAYDSMMSAAGNDNQWHKSEEGKAQLQNVYKVAQDLGFMTDGKFSAQEMETMQELIETAAAGGDIAAKLSELQSIGAIPADADLEAASENLQAVADQIANVQNDPNGELEGGGSAAPGAEDEDLSFII